MDIGKIIVALMVILFIVVLIAPVKLTPEEKRCSADSDCEFVKKVCCPSCDSGIGSVNKEFSDKLNLDMEKNCSSVECPQLYCENPYGESYMLKPACVNNVCSQKTELRCSAVCAYYDKKNTSPYALYLSNTALSENVTITDLAYTCDC